MKGAELYQINELTAEQGEDPKRYYDRKSGLTPEKYFEILDQLSTTLYIGNLSFFTTEWQLQEYLGISGLPVNRLIMGLNKQTKQTCGFCFIELFSREAAQMCQKVLNTWTIDTRAIRCDWDHGFVHGRQYGRGKQGFQVRDEISRESEDAPKDKERPLFRPARGGRGGRGGQRGAARETPRSENAVLSQEKTVEQAPDQWSNKETVPVASDPWLAKQEGEQVAQDSNWNSTEQNAITDNITKAEDPFNKPNIGQQRRQFQPRNENRGGGNNFRGGRDNNKKFTPREKPKEEDPWASKPSEEDQWTKTNQEAKEDAWGQSNLKNEDSNWNTQVGQKRQRDEQDTSKQAESQLNRESNGSGW